MEAFILDGGNLQSIVGLTPLKPSPLSPTPLFIYIYI